MPSPATGDKNRAPESAEEAALELDRKDLVSEVVQRTLDTKIPSIETKAPVVFVADGESWTLQSLDGTGKAPMPRLFNIASSWRMSETGNTTVAEFTLGNLLSALRTFDFYRRGKVLLKSGLDSSSRLLVAVDVGRKSVEIIDVADEREFIYYISPSGKYVAYAKWSGESFDSYAAELDGERRKFALAEKPLDEVPLYWFVDGGERIALRTEPQGAASFSGSPNLRFLSAAPDGRGLRVESERRGEHGLVLRSEQPRLGRMDHRQVFVAPIRVLEKGAPLGRMESVEEWPWQNVTAELGYSQCWSPLWVPNAGRAFIFLAGNPAVKLAWVCLARVTASGGPFDEDLTWEVKKLFKVEDREKFGLFFAPRSMGGAACWTSGDYKAVGQVSPLAKFRELLLAEGAPPARGENGADVARFARARAREIAPTVEWRTDDFNYTIYFELGKRPEGPVAQFLPTNVHSVRLRMEDSPVACAELIALSELGALQGRKFGPGGPNSWCLVVPDVDAPLRTLGAPRPSRPNPDVAVWHKARQELAAKRKEKKERRTDPYENEILAYLRENDPTWTENRRKLLSVSLRPPKDFSKVVHEGRLAFVESCLVWVDTDGEEEFAEAKSVVSLGKIDPFTDKEAKALGVRHPEEFERREIDAVGVLYCHVRAEPRRK